MKANINVTIKTTPHPDPKRAIDVFAKIVLKEILKDEKTIDSLPSSS